MRRTLVVLALVAAVAVPAALGAAAPALRTMSLAPFQVRGLRFEPGERVSLRLNVDGTIYGRVVRTTRAGTFKVMFTAASVPRCTPWIVTARGSLGSRATLRHVVFVDCPQP